MHSVDPSEGAFETPGHEILHRFLINQKIISASDPSCGRGKELRALCASKAARWVLDIMYIYLGCQDPYTAICLELCQKLPVV